jgi:aminoacyl tRNA synthase complex-interacting multifunctional protein 1
MAPYMLQWYVNAFKPPFEMTRFNDLQAKFSPSETYAYPSITRYFDHIQNLPSVKSLNAYPTVAFDFDNAPKIERVAELPKDKKKDKPVHEVAQSVPTSTSSSTPTAPATVAPPSNSTPGGSDQKATKKEKKEKPAKKETPALANDSKAKGAAAAAAATSDSGEPLPSMIDLRVGKIVQGLPWITLVGLVRDLMPFRFLVARHPDADGLYVEVRLAIW